jgi:hypothetical protein
MKISEEDISAAFHFFNEVRAARPPSALDAQMMGRME